MIAFACGLLVVNFSWFTFNAIVVLQTHLLKLTFEFTPVLIVKDNKIEVVGNVQLGVMKQILDGCC
jgi:hypothetical protein